MSTTTQPKHRPDNRYVAERNEIAVLKLIRDFGHLRRSEVARGVWGASSPGVAEKMAGRTVRRLLEKRLLQERPNSLGGRSLVLAARGAAYLRILGVDARDGCKLSSVGGPQFFHRTLGSRYLIERAAGGDEALGEYALLKNFGPVGRRELAGRYGKVPDGIVLTPGVRRGYDADILAADWVEVESSYKPQSELEKIFAVAWKAGSWLNAAETLLLDRVVFVYDECTRHENQIVASLRRYLVEHPANDSLLSSVRFARCTLALPLVWICYEEIDFRELDETRRKHHCKAGHLDGFVAPRMHPLG